MLRKTRCLSLFAGSHKSSKKRKLEKRQVTDLNSWLEAWNRYATCRIASDSDATTHYHTKKTSERSTPSSFGSSRSITSVGEEITRGHAPWVSRQLPVTNHRYKATAGRAPYVPSVIEYDRLFRQAAARDRAMRWDSPKEDIYVWALTQSNSTSNNVASHFSTGNNLSGGNSTIQSFRDRVPIAARLGPPVKPNTPNTDRATHLPSGKEICKRFNLGKCTKGEDCIFAHNCWHSNCQGDHPGKGCPKRF